MNQQELQSLRNNLAHTQNIVAGDWAQIARIARELAREIEERHIASVSPSTRAS